jgi:hypothetical protein
MEKRRLGATASTSKISSAVDIAAKSIKVSKIKIKINGLPSKSSKPKT